MSFMSWHRQACGNFSASARDDRSGDNSCNFPHRARRAACHSTCRQPALPTHPDTRGMIGRAELAAMPQGALLVNYARGAVIDRPVRSWLLLGCESVLPSAAWLARLCCIFILYRFVPPPPDRNVVSLTAWVDIMLQSPFLSCKPEVCVRCVALDKTLQQNFSQVVISCCATTVHDAHCDCFITVPACGSA